MLNCLPSGGCGHSGILQGNTSMCSRLHSKPLSILSNILLPSLHLGPISILQMRDPVLQAKVVPSHVILFWNDHGTTNCLLILLSVPVAHVAVHPVQDVHSDIKQSPEKIGLNGERSMRIHGETANFTSSLQFHPGSSYFSPPLNLFFIRFIRQFIKN